MRRLHSLDALRGTAALTVVLWHWQHFYALSGSWMPGWNRAAQPFYLVLKPFYDAGWAAVDLFFALSGFVFFWLYSEAIAARTVGPGRFALLRFSRLYPLHLATLLIVAVLQVFFFRATGSYFIYDADSWQRFAASIVMAQQWLPPTLDQTFNGPAWSVSIEVLLYIVFFALARSGLKDMRTAIDMALVGLVLFFLLNEMIGRGVMGFFLGGAVWHATERAKAHVAAKSIARGVALLAILSWAVVLIEVYFGPIQAAGAALATHLPWAMREYYTLEAGNFLLLGFIFVVTPLTLAALALHEQVLGGRYERVSFLGDISYSSYLVHFPMQLSLALIALHLGWQPHVFESGWVLAAFYAALVKIAWASYTFFERPMQSLIRRFGERALLPAE
jgi:peptidoglycan/LPS O-acetylase OafA/YrhL